MNVPRKRLAVLISGRGSNLEAILKATQDASYPAEVVLVISDNSDAGGLELALNSEIDAFALERTEFNSRTEHETEISNLIDDYNIDLICLAGYMRILSADFASKFDGRLINIHPSLLPKFKGLDTHARAIKADEKEHGCTVHYVNSEMDGGEIIQQSIVPVEPEDTEQSLAARVLVEEHKLYPSVIADLCQT